MEERPEAAGLLIFGLQMNALEEATEKAAALAEEARRTLT